MACLHLGLHVTRLHLEVSDAIFEYSTSSKTSFGLKTPGHVNQPIHGKPTQEIMAKNKHRKNIHDKSNIPGYPGYRTRPGRSGYDPVDRGREAGHMQGVFWRQALTGQLRTRKPVYLVLMFLFGVLPFVLVFVGLVDTFVNWVQVGIEFRKLSNILLIVLPIVAFTGILTYNFLINILVIVGVLPSLKQTGTQKNKTKKRQKNHPKRRKDYK